MGKNIKRRNFFELFGKGTIAAIVLSAIPFKALFSNKRNTQSIKVEIHPLAVKRNKRGLNG
ncbi:MAG: hypothetical protein NTX22_05200 [Ignavibacteriales bacterium]|nr:hypothetical protein [Ignavibacteriales bacterium]